ncbi:hypothetical protein [Microlunatus parietis]|uniref:Prenyltransferase and squalene oxidase repeat-containing protein n=1 Tax=Microlunatus parietis TaxID=682979 RepID=A0A7Y9LAE2_9ACTN|nr:hypothetical protein [Microlunatus parietis]NYE72749.1 hypothetical protein [Microlunatus parietis]
MDWLLESDEPGIRDRTHRELLDTPGDESPSRILAGPRVSALLAEQQPDGALGPDLARVGRYRGSSRSPENLRTVETVRRSPSRRWSTTLWRLASLIDLAAPADDPRIAAAVEYVLDHAVDLPRHRHGPTMINGLARVCAGGEGSVLRIACWAGLADDPRTHRMAKALLDWQWPDGGWNCHRNASGRRSSFDESLLPAWGLHEYATAIGDSSAAEAVDRAAELFLDHRLLYSLGSGIPSRWRPKPPPAGQMINSRWAKLSYPSTWHYDLLSVLRFLARTGRIDDRRGRDGLDLLIRKRRRDGLWAADAQWGRSPDNRAPHPAPDWGAPKEPNPMITLLTLGVLRAAAAAGSGAASR